MLKGIFNQMSGNKPQQQNQGGMNDFLGAIKGKSPDQLEGMARMYMQQNGGMNQSQIKQFEQLAKMFGATDKQINDFKNKL